CSFNFEEIRTAKTPAERAAHFMRAARNLESSGADLILICANTGHVQADSIRANVKIPLLHIVDAIAAEIKKRGLRKVGLLATKQTFEAPFYTSILAKHDIELLVPEKRDIHRVDEIIRTELMMGRAKDTSQFELEQIVLKMKTTGAEGVVLGCTEIPPLIDERKINFPCFDSTRIHATAAVNMALI